MTPPDLDALRERLDYDPASGLFRWKKRLGGPVKVGTVAGSLNSEGYRFIAINYVDYRAAYLAWFWMTGNWPSQIIDHRNGIRSDDRFENLRLATKPQNGQNMKIRRDNSSGFKGVSRARKGWQAYLTHNRHRLWLGVFESPQMAGAIRNWAAEMLHGEFARSA